MRILFKLILVTLTLGVLSTPTYAESKEKSAELKETDSTKGLMVNQRAPFFSIVLASNSSTGYSWFLVEDNNSAIIPLDHHYEAPKADQPGAGGFEKWDFRIKSDKFVVPHLLKLRVVYMRPWEGKPIKDIIFTIITQQK